MSQSGLQSRFGGLEPSCKQGLILNDEFPRLLCTCVHFISLQLFAGMSLFFGAALDDVVLRVVHNAGIRGLLAYNGYCAMARTGEGGREGGVGKREGGSGE